MREFAEQVVMALVGIGASSPVIYKLLSWWLEKRRLDMDRQKLIEDQRDAYTTEVKSDAEMWRELYMQERAEHRETLDKLHKERVENAHVQQAYARELASMAELSEASEQEDDDGG